MAKLIVNRKSSIVGAARKFKVFLNNEVVGEVKNGDSTEIEQPAGEYDIRSGISTLNGMTPTIKIHLTDGETTTVDVGASTGTFFFYVIAIFFGVFFMSFFRNNIFVVLGGLALSIFSIYYYFKNNTFIKVI